MPDVLIKVQGAIVVLMEGANAPIDLLCVKMRSHRHRTELLQDEDVETIRSDRLTIRATPQPKTGQHDMNNILLSSQIGMTIPMRAKAERIIRLPPGHLYAGALYPGQWKVKGSSASFSIANEVHVTLAGVEELVATQPGDDLKLDPSSEITIRHWPIADEADRDREYKAFEHFTDYAFISHEIPANITTPQNAEAGGVVIATPSSVCPPVGHKG